MFQLQQISIWWSSSQEGSDWSPLEAVFLYSFNHTASHHSRGCSWENREDSSCVAAGGADWLFRCTLDIFGSVTIMSSSSIIFHWLTCFSFVFLCTCVFVSVLLWCCAWRLCVCDMDRLGRNEFIGEVRVALKKLKEGENKRYNMGLERIAQVSVCLRVWMDFAKNAKCFSWDKYIWSSFLFPVCEFAWGLSGINFYCYIILIIDAHQDSL